jgi:surfactin synthase thioesterase subunit
MQRSGTKRLQLVCLPYAGASATVFSRFQKLAPSWLEVLPLELPGRGRRSAEPFAKELTALADELSITLLAKLEGPFALFGHSMGAILAFELASRLTELGRTPAGLFASASSSPPLRRTERFVALDDDASLLAEMRRLNGTRREVFESPELLALALPILRADFAMCARYRYWPRQTLTSAIHAFGGSRDDIGVAELEAWRVHTRGAFSLDVLDGDHFFLHSQERRLLELIARHAEAWRARGDDGARTEVHHG